VPFDGRRIYDSDSILKMQFIPKTMAVVGGGVIGCEYASVFTALGVAVTLVESREGLLPAIDHEIAGRLQAQLEQLGLPPVLPYAIYTIPEIAIAGLTEEECVAKGIPYLVGRAEYAQNPRGQIIGETHGMLRLIFSPADKKLLGAHHIGELSSELVHIGAHALFDGATIDEFIMSVYNYPTLSDVYKYAAYDGLGAWERWQA